MCVQSDYDPNLLELRALMRRYACGTASTFDLLEKTFAHLTDLAKRTGRSFKSTAYVKWLYTTTSPYIKTSGTTQILPSHNHFRELAGFWSQQKSVQKERYDKCFDLDATILPYIQLGESAPDPLKKSSLKLHRTCGPTGHHRAVAAMAFAMHDAAHGFQHKDRAWVGALHVTREMLSIVNLLY